MSILINLLANNGYIIVNKEIIKKIGLHEAIILGELCSEYTYWEKNNKLDNGYFYSTRENIAENTGLTPYQQRLPLARLEKMGIVLVKSKGMPLQKWYSLNMDILFEILKDKTGLITSSKETSHQDIEKLDNKIEKNFTTSYENFEQQDVKKFNVNNNKNNNINNNKNDYLCIDSYIEKAKNIPNKKSSIDVDSDLLKNAKEKYGEKLEGLYANFTT